MKPLIQIAFLTLVVLFSGCLKPAYYSEPAKGFPTAEMMKKSPVVLDMSDIHMLMFPETVRNMKKLRTLNISGNPGLPWDQVFSGLAELPDLEVLILDNCSLTELPDSVVLLTNLKHLSLDGNQLGFGVSSVEKLEKLPHLQILNLSNNQLEWLPIGIENLAALKSLRLTGNKLGSSRDFITLGKLDNLQSLWLDENNIEELPPEIGQLNQVRYLFLDFNSIQTLPTEMNGLERLWVIHIGHNRLNMVPKELIEMPGLRMAVLNANQIKMIPDDFQLRRYTMQAIVLDGNPLSEEEKKRAKKMFRRFFMCSVSE